MGADSAAAACAFFFARHGKALFHQGFKLRPVADRVFRDFFQHICDVLHEQIRIHDVRGAALGILGFSLVVLAAIDNMTLAAVPVIYANVHFCAAVFTEKQAGQRVDLSVPAGAWIGYNKLDRFFKVV